MIKFSLNILLFLLITSCTTQSEKQQLSVEESTDSADTLKLSELLNVDEQEKIKTENSKPNVKRKSISLQSLEASPCNMNVMLYAYENIDSMSLEAIDIFLQAFSEKCDNNVEFSEFSQEMIFGVFANYPKEVAELITRNQYDMKAINSELEAPLLDPKVKPIIADLKSTKIRNPKIDSIIAALERADKYLNEE